ncbi:MAG: hypothetical protein AUJ92_03215 [Armatimonadetes bacterium CG2_30_59_28]|nr:MAG: hypothetical protein AUJ92_03215 [Armatimonadetes bacterium CG2_30_59_28]PIU66415.1 MAG: hypothetical protein COS85_04850 [Armatimonadetes bacterium CG07_land_8_20_14_0_80_59_28]PIY45731.1 MAG: hypothetical protein COZ05_06260 [Armatimonadetes bacterium CG_4_10_14_3_um_filter_59_10]
MRIPFASLGITPTADLRYPFNLSVRKQGDDPWGEWRGTGNCTWYLPEAGFVTFARRVGGILSWGVRKCPVRADGFSSAASGQSIDDHALLRFS